MSSASLFQKVMKNAALLVGGRGMNAPLSLAYMALSARLLGVEDFGVVVLVNAYALTVGSVVKLESWQAVLHFGTKPLNEGKTEDFYRILRFSLLLDLASAVAGVVLGIGGALLFAPLMGWPPEAKLPGIVYVTSTVFMVAAAPTGVLRMFGRFDILAMQSVVSSAVRVVAMGAVILAGGGIVLVLAAWYAGTVVAFVAMAIWAWAELHRRGHSAAWRVQGPLTQGFPGLWRLIWAANVSSSVDQVFNQLASLAVGGILGPAEAGFFRIARQVATAVAKPAQLVVVALYPELAKLRASGDYRQLRKLAGQVGLAGGLAAMLLIVLAAVAGKPLLVLTMGPAFAAATPILIWLVAAAGIQIWATPLEPVLISTGRTGAVIRVRLIVSVLFMFALFVSTKAYGLTGAGAASVGASLLMLAGMLISVISWSRSVDARTAGSPPPAALDPAKPVPPAAVEDGELGYRQ